jgi:DNA-binding transcriptional ArsR family regulator
MRQRKGAPSIGPLTDAAWTPARKGRPPAICEEFHARLEKPGDFVLLWTGAFRLADEGGTKGSWGTLTVSLGEAPPGAQGPVVSQVSQVPAAHVERMLSPLAHEGRVNLLEILYAGPRTSGELSALTGLKGGNLHYHLRELAHAHYVEQREGRHRITNLGAQMLITVTSIAALRVKDRGEEGLEIDGAWGEASAA